MDNEIDKDINLAKIEKIVPIMLTPEQSDRNNNTINNLDSNNNKSNSQSSKRIHNEDIELKIDDKQPQENPIISQEMENLNEKEKTIPKSNSADSPANNNEIKNKNIELMQRNEIKNSLGLGTPNVNIEMERIDISKKLRYKFYFAFYILLTTASYLVGYFNLESLRISDPFKNSSEIYYIISLLENWEKNLIQTIDLSNNGLDLTNNFGYWKGNSEGCICDNNYISQDLCKFNKTFFQKHNCREIKRELDTKIQIWNGEILLQKNQKNEKKLNYFDLKIENRTTSCGSGFKKCGIIDTLKNNLCMRETEDCPVLFLKFSKNEPIKKFADDKILKLKNGYLIYNNNPLDYPNATIPIEFKVSENQPCKNSFYSHKNYSLYKLDFFYNKNECYISSEKPDNKTLFYDYEYKLIDQIDYKVFFDENKISAKNYNRNSINLYTRNYIGTKVDCLKKHKDLKIIKHLKEYRDREKIITNNELPIFIIFSYIIVLCIMLSFVFIKKRGFKKVFYLNIVGSIILTFLFFIIAQGFTTQSMFGLDIIFEEKCFDDFTNEVYSIYKAKVDLIMIYIKFTVMLYIFGTCLMIFLSLFILFNYFKLTY